MAQDMPMPPLNALRAFEAAARHGSFARAAQELHVTPGAVSQQVRLLEEYLGVALFERTGQGLRLSASGTRALPKLSAAFESLAKAARSLNPERGRDVFVITSGPAFAAQWLAPRTDEIRRAIGGAELRIQAGLAFMDLAREAVDVAIRFGRVDTSCEHSERLVEEHLLPLCAPAIASSAAADAALLHDDSARLVDPELPDWAQWSQQPGAKPLALGPGVRFNQADHALQAAASGAGLLLGRLVLAWPLMSAGRLVSPFGPAVATGLAFHLVCSKDRLADSRVQRLRDWLHAALGPVQPPQAEG